MKREEMIGFIVRSLDNMMMRNAVGDEKSEKKGMMPVMQGWIIGYLYDHKEEEIFQRDIEAEFYIARSTVTCLVKQMEQKGYIARVAVERDCRSVFVFWKKEKNFMNVFYKILIMWRKRFVRESMKKNCRLFLRWQSRFERILNRCSKAMQSAVCIKRIYN